MADENKAHTSQHTLIVYDCARCKKIILPGPVAAGYATRDGVDGKICYECCALYDKEDMRETGRITLYVVDSDIVTRPDGSKALPNCRYAVTNWPDTLRFEVFRDYETKHNWWHVGKVLHVWFVFEGDVWYGRHAGGMNQLVHCRRTKMKA